MLDFLRNTDKDLFLCLNGMHNGFFDSVMPYLTGFWVWIPLFIWWLYEVYKRHKLKTIAILFFAVALIFASDQSANVIKKSVKRYRPTHNIEIQEKVHVFDDYRGGEFGFVSGHASTSFAIAVFVFLLMRPDKKLFLLSLFLWACITAYSRIYLGVHYPLDILGGALLGSLIAFIFYKIYSKFVA